MRVQASPQFERDQIAAWVYIAEQSVEAADRFNRTLMTAIAEIAETPGIGHFRSDIPDAYRAYRVHSYLLIYRADAGAIRLIRLIHGHRDVGPLFNA